MAAPLIHRVVKRDAAPVTITVDGVAVEAFAGESVLVAVLAAGAKLRVHEVDGAPRAGFCLMGACQDCWVWLGDGTRARSCMTRVRDGMAISTALPKAPFGA